MEQKTQGKMRRAYIQGRNTVEGKGDGMLPTYVDIVFIIDGTGSMQNALDNVRDRALKLREQLITGLGDKNRQVERMRVKVVIFRDIYVDTNAYESSDFFVLEKPEDAQRFRDFMAGIKAEGGGDSPESSLEALYRAIKETEFTKLTPGQKGRHILVLMTDDSAHRLDDPQRVDDPEYPKGMPDSLAGVENAYEGMDPHLKRLIISAPNVWPWTAAGGWANADLVTTDQNKGIPDAVMEKVIDFLSGSF